jgi:energy-coupling factor transporter ATP-binding protein EcfA2
LLLLDEPTNHLDVGAVAWLRGYLREGLPGVTMLMVSHDADFLADVCTDVIHFAALRLDFYAGGMTAFRAARPDVVLPTRALAAAAASAHAGADAPPPDAGAPAGDAAGDGSAEDDAAVVAGLAAASAALAAGHIKPFVFPDPGLLDGIKSRNKSILRATDVSYTHPGAASRVLRHVSVRLCLASRVGIVGPNGAGACPRYVYRGPPARADMRVTSVPPPQAKPRCSGCWLVRRRRHRPAAASCGATRVCAWRTWRSTRCTIWRRRRRRRRCSTSRRASLAVATRRT